MGGACGDRGATAALLVVRGSSTARENVTHQCKYICISKSKIPLVRPILALI